MKHFIHQMSLKMIECPLQKLSTKICRRKPGEFEITEGYLEKEMSDEERIQLKEHIDHVISIKNGTQVNETLADGEVLKTRFPQYVRALTNWLTGQI